LDSADPSTPQNSSSLQTRLDGLINGMEVTLCTKLPVKNNVLTYDMEITLCTKLPVKNNVLTYGVEITLFTKLPVKNNVLFIRWR